MVFEKFSSDVVVFVFCFYPFHYSETPLIWTPTDQRKLPGLAVLKGFFNKKMTD